MSGVRWDIPQSYDLVRKTFEPLGPVMKKIFMPYDTRLSQPDFCIKAIVTNIAKEFQGLGCEVILQAVRSKKEAIAAVKKQLATVHAVAGFGLHFDTEKEISYICGMSKRIFISDRGDFGFENGASIASMPEDPSLLYTSITQMIRNFWWHRKSPSTHAVITLYPEAKFNLVNRFMLPYWASYIMDNIPVDEELSVVTNYWPDCPLKFNDMSVEQDSANAENDAKLNKLLDQLFLLQDCLF
jgi:hypothetical protein